MYINSLIVSILFLAFWFVAGGLMARILHNKDKTLKYYGEVISVLGILLFFVGIVLSVFVETLF